MNKTRSRGPARIRPTRKAELKVFGHAPRHDRHVVALSTPGDGAFASIEVWTYAEYESLTDWERIAVGANHIPGIGWILFRKGLSKQEHDDVYDIYCQAVDRHYLMRGEH